MSDRHKLMREQCIALLETLGFQSVTFLFGRCGRGPCTSACLRVSPKSPLIAAHEVVPGHPAVIEVRDEDHNVLGTLVLRAEEYPLVKAVLYSVSIYPTNKV